MELVASYFGRFEEYLLIFLHWKIKIYRRSKHFKWLGL